MCLYIFLSFQMINILGDLFQQFFQQSGKIVFKLQKAFCIISTLITLIIILNGKLLCLSISQQSCECCDKDNIA